MILNLFSRKKNAFLFESDEWKYEEKSKKYYLKINLQKTVITPNSKVYLYKLQGDRYIFISEGFEDLIGNEVVYCAQFPFSGKMRIK